MTVTRKYTIELTITVDDEDADVLKTLDRKYASGAMKKAAMHGVFAVQRVDNYMGIHRAILARQGITYGKGFVADHINGDNGDNTRNNLRVLTSRQNRLTAVTGASKQSQYLGVSWKKDVNKWAAYYVHSHNGRYKTKAIGTFTDERDAAIAYDAYLIANRIDKPLNFPDLVVAS